MGFTAYMITLSVLLIAGATAGRVARRRTTRARRPSGPAGPAGSSDTAGPAGLPRSSGPSKAPGPFGPFGSSGSSGSSGPSDLDAEVEANHWLIRLGGGLVPPGARAWAGADDSAERALTSAAECHRTARAQLEGARTAGEYGEVTRVAKEGLEHLRVARAALDIGSGSAHVSAPVSGEVSRAGAVGMCAVRTR
ncbi:hypothetical protein [Streptomyces sp. NPDC005476]|uniref:hypothetical protein n=1 Tax=Streptomyces sp. NPDC005476 TaxID=3156882 RepID=UPI003453BB1A